MSNSFGTTRILAGVHQATTSNPDGTAINFWDAAAEGAEATTVALSNPHMAAADAYGNVYIADKASHAVLKITTDGVIHTFAGTHTPGFNGDGPAQATTLQIENPNGLFVLPDGTVYLLDPDNRRIRRVGTNNVMTTVVIDLAPDWLPSGRALWVSPDEKLIYYTHELPGPAPDFLSSGAVVKKWTPTGGIQIVCDASVGFRNPGNIAVNPVDGKLYVTDRAEDDTTKLAPGLFRIDGPNQRTRMTGDGTQPNPANGQLALASFIDEPRGLAFRPDGSYFLCGHKDGSVWFVDTAGMLHQYLEGAGSKDKFVLTDGLHPPLTDKNYFAQPRSVTLAPNGNLTVVCNDSGFVFSVDSVSPPDVPADLRLAVPGTNGVRLSWTGVFGRGYRVERSLDLVPARWQPIGAVGGNAGGGFIEFVDALAAKSARGFYRILPSL
ncbi:MAG: hypothetical protein HY043_04825 [Verrucomicrobia bacterium]|nr:hypothetical protein [Verrucomicrobiota bacterium]